MQQHGIELTFHRWGRLVYRFRRAIVAVWFILFAALIPFALRLPAMLEQNGFSPAESPSQAGIDKLEHGLGLSAASLDIVVVSRSGENLTTREAENRILQSLEPLGERPFIRGMYVNFATRRAGQDHITGISVLLNESSAEALRHFDEITAAVPEIPDADTYITGNTAVFDDMNRAVKHDILRAESIGIPAALLILLLVFGTLTSALLPLAVGMASVTVSMGLLYFTAAAHGSLSNFLPNIVTMLGLAVGIDYALFIVSRFREEIARKTAEEAVAITSATAGKAVMFSGAAVWIGFLAMSFIDLPIFETFCIGGVTVVIVSVLAANTLLPALLGILGERVETLSVFPVRVRRVMADRAPGFWRAVSRFVMSRPVLVSVLVITGLMLAMAPLRTIKAGIPSAEVLPPSYESRYGYDLLKQAYDVRELNPILVAADLPDSYPSEKSIRAVKGYMDEVRKLPGVHRVESYISIARGSLDQMASYLSRPDVMQRLENYHIVRDRVAAVAVVPEYGESHAVTERLVKQLRAIQTEDLKTYVTGTPAYKLDIMDEIRESLPSVLWFVFAVTYLVLLIAFRSVVLPLKAGLMSVLSLGAGLGIVIWVFQEGIGADLFGVTYTGSVFALLPVLIFCVVYGISMDYEVILLSRIMENYEVTGDNERSTAAGLENTGGLITSAALILTVVAGAFIFTDNEVMKTIGLGLTAAVLLDATIIRILLVPAFMKLLGPANWWSPAWLFPGRKPRKKPSPEPNGKA